MLSGYTPKSQMAICKTEVVRHLFTEHEPVFPNLVENKMFVSFTLDELQRACQKLKNNKAPGPGNIPRDY